jgi:aryl-alcohol dehydrogenase-like predicted oxidoreductase
MVPLADVEIGMGTSSWGSGPMWGFGRDYTAKDLQEAFAVAQSNGVLIDTAEIYGRGQSERFIGQFNTHATQPVPIATKFFPFPWRWTPQSLMGALRASLARLQTARVSLYQIHWPLPPVSATSWMKAMTQAAELGLIEYIGVSNYDRDLTLKAFNTLKRFGVMLAANQVKYNLLDRTIEHNGLLSLCKDLGIRVIAYSPLEQGLLTGKYSPANVPAGLRGVIHRRKLGAIQPLIETMRQIGKGYAVDGVIKTPAQVAINWCICQGTLPIPGAKNARQAGQNLGAVGWRLSQEDVAVLSSVSREVNINLESES